MQVAADGRRGTGGARGPWEPTPGVKEVSRGQVWLLAGGAGWWEQEERWARRCGVRRGVGEVTVTYLITGDALRSYNLGHGLQYDLSHRQRRGGGVSHS